MTHSHTVNQTIREETCALGCISRYCSSSIQISSSTRTRVFCQVCYKSTQTRGSMGLDGGTKITRSDVLRRQSSRWGQQDTSRSTRGGSVSHVYQEKQIDEQIRRAIIWTTCALSGLPFIAPIVADALGQLFNKQSVLEHLLAVKAAAGASADAAAAAAAAGFPAQPLALPAEAAAAAAPTAAPATAPARSSAGSIISYSAPAAAAAAAAAPPKELEQACLRYKNQQRAAAAAAAASGDASAAAQGTFDHIKSLKDVFVVQLTPNPDAGGLSAHINGPTVPGSAVAGHSSNGNSISNSSNGRNDLPSPWMCPVTMQPCGSKQPCSALRPCGHVLSQKALAAITPAKPKGAKSSTAGGTGTAGAAGGTAGGTGAPQSSRTAEQSRQEELQPDRDDLGCIEEVVDCCCCPVCEVGFDPAKDVVLIGGSQQHMDAVRVQLREAAAAKAQVKQKKRKRAAEAAEQQQQQQQQQRPLLALPSTW